MRIGGRCSLRWDGRLEALCNEVEHCSDLLAGDIELFHHFVDAEIFQVLDDGGDWRTGVAEDPSTTDLARDAFDGMRTKRWLAPGR
jgi:hypothetical protein